MTGQAAQISGLAGGDDAEVIPVAARGELPVILPAAPGRNIVTTQLRSPVGVGEHFEVYGRRPVVSECENDLLAIFLIAGFHLYEGRTEATQMAEKSVWPKYRQIVKAIILIGTGQDR